MSPALQARDLLSFLDDLSAGVVGGVSERRLKPKHLKNANNMIGRPYRATSVRGGSRDLSSAVLAAEPHSLAKFYGVSPKIFVCAENDIYEVTPTAYTIQALPLTPSSNEIWIHDNLNGVLWMTQRLGSQLPIFYDGTWLSMALVAPAAAPTFAADTLGGAVDVGTHFYRVRWRYDNGSSLSGPVSAAHVVAAPNQIVNINANLVPGAPRADYVGWTLERTKIGGTATGPFYFVADGTAATYADSAADADLLYLTDEGIHGQPPHLDGLVGYGDRLVGWAGSTLHFSQNIGDAEATGICNFDAELQVLVAKDDGDSIQTVLVVGDRLLVLKRRSAHVLDGTDPESFVLTAIGSGAAEQGGEVGAVGPRAATAVGTTAYFFGEGGLFQFSSGRIRPIGWVEVGHYFDTINPAERHEILLVNYLGDYLLVNYPVGGQLYNSEIVVKDLRFDNWWHWTNWRMRDAIVQKDSGFSNATLIFCDPKATTQVAAVGTGASFYAWSDKRAGAWQAYVQKLNAAGVAQWTANGVQVSSCIGTSAFIDPLVVSDGLGGCVVLWYDDRVAGSGAGYYLGRRTSTGVLDWEVFLTATTPSEDRALVPDGFGGVVAVVNDAAGTPNTRVFGFDLGGLPVGAPYTIASGAEFRPDAVVPDGFGGLLAGLELGIDGMKVCRFTVDAVVWTSLRVDVGTNFWLKPVADGSGGAIVTWTSFASGAGDVFAQRVDSTGALAWGLTGIQITSGPANEGGNEHILRIVSDGAGGAIIAWMNGSANDLYAQRVNNGSIQWASGGVVVAAAANAQGVFIGMVADGSGGAIIAYSDSRTGQDNIHAQRVNASGVMQWIANGITVCAAADNQDYVFAVSDGASGAIVVWEDFRPGAGVTDVYAARIEDDANLPWTLNGVAVCSAAGSQKGRGLASDTASLLTDGYHVWAGLDGQSDERRADNSGGVPIPWYVETPLIDDGEPGLVKMLRRLQFYIEADPTDVTVTLFLDPSGRTIPIPFAVAGSGKDWAEDAVPHPDDLEWDQGDWATDAAVPLTAGLPQGTLCQRYSLRLSGASRGAVEYSGHEITGFTLPGRRMDR